jgi:hypothetical protein
LIFRNKFVYTQIQGVTAVIGALANKYVDSYLTCTSAKELWDALDEKFGVSNASSKLYIIEQLFDYKMAENRLVVK